MKIAVASGKGGAGKTTIAVNLAVVSGRESSHKITYADCDAEEPNGHLFLKPVITGISPVEIPVPQIDFDKCDYCGECAKICRFSALAVIKENVLVFPEMCHGCGGCSLICPQKAITEIPRQIGEIKTGTAGNLNYISGLLRIGDATVTPIIRRIKNALPPDGITFIDAPPGTSCPVVESMKDVDHVLLVTEPTPFGLHDLKLAVETVRTMGLPFSVIINRCDAGDSRAVNYCQAENIDILAGIKHSREAAEIYSRGGLLVDELEDFYQTFKEISEKLFYRVKALKGIPTE